LALLDASLRLLREDQEDPRGPEAIAHYEKQREELVARIQASNPPPVVVQASAGTLAAKKRG
jgi:hypothetical protein